MWMVHDEIGLVLAHIDGVREEDCGNGRVVPKIIYHQVEGL